MTRARPDYRKSILRLLRERGPLRLAQLVVALGDPVAHLVEYDVRVLREKQRIERHAGMWRLREGVGR